MKRKYKFTPFARMFFFLIFFVPIAYFGFKIYNGDMTVGDLKSKIENIGSSNSSSADPVSTQPKGNVTDSQCEQLLILKDREIEILKERIALLEN